jgi:tryptophan synthase beta chain
MRLGKQMGPGGLIVVNLSGRGDKDVATAARWFGMDLGAGVEVTEGR